VEFLSCSTPDFISPLLWPPNSPDLNPVDYEVWGVLQQRVYHSRIRFVDHWKQRLIEEWALLRPEHHCPSSLTVACSTTHMCPHKRRPLWAQTVTDVIVYQLLRQLSILETSVFEFHFLNSCCSETVVAFVEICNVCTRKAIIKAANRIFNSDKICRSYRDFYFGITFLEHSVCLWSLIVLFIGWHDRSWTISISNLSLLLTVTSNNFISSCRYIQWNCSYKIS